MKLNSKVTVGKKVVKLNQDKILLRQLP